MSRKRLVYIFSYLTLLLSLAFAGLVSMCEPGGYRQGMGTVVRSMVHFPFAVYDKLFGHREHSALPRDEMRMLVSMEPGNAGIVPEGNVLVSYYDPDRGQTVVELLDIRTDTTLETWVLPAEEEQIWESDPEFMIPGIAEEGLGAPVLLDDSSVIIVRNAGPVFRLSKDGKVLWTVPGPFKTTLEPDQEGNVWCCRMVSKDAQDEPYRNVPFIDNLITCISPGGEVLKEYSVASLFEKAELNGIALGINTLEEAPFQCASVRPARFGSDFWHQGDVLVSLGNKSLVFLLHTEDASIGWFYFGPWLHPTDASFVDSVHIAVLGTNIVRRPVAGDLLLPGSANLFYVNLLNDSISAPFTRLFEKTGIEDDLLEGRFSIADDWLFIEDSRHGLRIGGDERGVTWVRCWPRDTVVTKVSMGSRILLENDSVNAGNAPDNGGYR